MATWVERVGERAKALSQDEKLSHALCNAFMFVAHEWADTDVSLGPPLLSGITSEGLPVELSTKRHRNSDAVDLRFIAQPGRPGKPPSDDLLFVKDRAVEFTYEYAGIGAASFVAAAIDSLAASATKGNFFLWLGIDLTEPEKGIVKVYVNPWAARSKECGLTLIDKILGLASFGSSIPYIEALLDLNEEIVPHIVGINLDTLGARSIKLYFPCADISLNRLITLANIFPDSNIFSESLLRTAGLVSATSGEVHAALTWSRGVATPRFRASLYCPHWFVSDADVQLMSSFLYKNNDIDTPILESFAERRWFTFVGIDGDDIVLYSRV